MKYWEEKKMMRNSEKTKMMKNSEKTKMEMKDWEMTKMKNLGKMENLKGKK